MLRLLDNELFHDPGASAAARCLLGALDGATAVALGACITS